MGFQQKDLKILWGKAAGRCSMPECREQLVSDASDVVPSKAILLGENCHIVAEKSNGPRGESSLTLENRNRYPNLILLCATHHTVIDQDPTSWSIELLHQIKADHEVWVETQLAAVEETEATRYYSEMINRATEELVLDRWTWVCDNAFRCILVEEFVDGINAFCEFTNRAIWPSGYDEVRDAITNLSDRLYIYMQHFMSRARYVEGTNGDTGHFIEDKSWKKIWREDYDEYAEKSTKWQKSSVDMLANIVVALNDFAHAVRESLKPSYFLYEGKFTLIDSLGMSTDGFTSTYYIPDTYIEVE
ncbi:hypothetical protein ACWWD9_07140 [Methylovorus sp. SPW-M1]